MAGAGCASAQNVTAMLVGSTGWFGVLSITVRSEINIPAIFVIVLNSPIPESAVHNRDIFSLRFFSRDEIQVNHPPPVLGVANHLTCIVVPVREDLFNLTPAIL